jgi:hypothetical protein
VNPLLDPHASPDWHQLEELVAGLATSTGRSQLDVVRELHASRFIGADDDARWRTADEVIDRLSRQRNPSLRASDEAPRGEVLAALTSIVDDADPEPTDPEEGA